MRLPWRPESFLSEHLSSEQSVSLERADTLADDFLAGEALLFLISCLLSYWAMRSRSLCPMHRLEKIADGILILAMIGMVMICALITYTISVPPRSGAA